MGIHHLLDEKDMGWSLYDVEPQCILSLPSTPFFDSFPISKDLHFFDKYHQIPYNRKAVKDDYLHALKLQQAASKYQNSGPHYENETK